jgi:hypothetical protein
MLLGQIVVTAASACSATAMAAGMWKVMKQLVPTLSRLQRCNLTTGLSYRNLIAELFGAPSLNARVVVRVGVV